MSTATAARAADYTIYLDAYPNFPTQPYSDITSFLKQAMSDIKEYFVPDSQNPFDNWIMNLAEIKIPAGIWKITEKKVINLTVAGGYAWVSGIKLSGAGFQQTKIFYEVNEDNDTNFFAYNECCGYMHFCDLHFVDGTNKNVDDPATRQYGVGGFFHNNGTGNEKWAVATFIFERVYLTGFKRGYRADGDVMTSEVTFRDSRFRNTPPEGYCFWQNNKQGVNINFYSTHMELIEGIAFKFSAGGCLNVYGGSYILSGEGMFFESLEKTGYNIDFGNNNFNFYGIRLELRDPVSGFLNMYSRAKLNFNNCSLAYQTSKGSIRSTVVSEIGSLRFVECSYGYKMRLKVRNGGAYAMKPMHVVFEGCQLTDELHNLFEVVGVDNTDTSNEITLVNTGGYPKVEAKNCYTMDENNHYKHQNVSLYRHVCGASFNTDSKKIMTIGKTDSIKRQVGNLSFGLPGGSYTVDIPVGATITKVIVYHMPQLPGIEPPANGKGKTFKYKVRLGSRDIFETGTFTHTEDKCFSSGDVVMYAADETDTLTIENTSEQGQGQGIYQRGYTMVEYI